MIALHRVLHTIGRVFHTSAAPLRQEDEEFSLGLAPQNYAVTFLAPNVPSWSFRLGPDRVFAEFLDSTS
jgi:hypothetical protein